MPQNHNKQEITCSIGGLFIEVPNSYAAMTPGDYAYTTPAAVLAQTLHDLQMRYVTVPMGVSAMNAQRATQEMDAFGQSVPQLLTSLNSSDFSLSERDKRGIEDILTNISIQLSHGQVKQLELVATAFGSAERLFDYMLTSSEQSITQLSTTERDKKVINKVLRNVEILNNFTVSALNRFTSAYLDGMSVYSGLEGAFRIDVGKVQTAAPADQLIEIKKQIAAIKADVANQAATIQSARVSAMAEENRKLMTSLAQELLLLIITNQGLLFRTQLAKPESIIKHILNTPITDDISTAVKTFRTTDFNKYTILALANVLAHGHKKFLSPEEQNDALASVTKMLLDPSTVKSDVMPAARGKDKTSAAEQGFASLCNYITFGNALMQKRRVTTGRSQNFEVTTKDFIRRCKLVDDNANPMHEFSYVYGGITNRIRHQIPSRCMAAVFGGNVLKSGKGNTADENTKETTFKMNGESVKGDINGGISRRDIIFSLADLAEAFKPSVTPRTTAIKLFDDVKALLPSDVKKNIYIQRELEKQAHKDVFGHPLVQEIFLTLYIKELMSLDPYADKGPTIMAPMMGTPTYHMQRDVNLPSFNRSTVVVDAFKRTVNKITGLLQTVYDDVALNDYGTTALYRLIDGLVGEVSQKYIDDVLASSSRGQDSSMYFLSANLYMSRSIDSSFTGDNVSIDISSNNYLIPQPNVDGREINEIKLGVNSMSLERMFITSNDEANVVRCRDIVKFEELIRHYETDVDSEFYRYPGKMKNFVPFIRAFGYRTDENRTEYLAKEAKRGISLRGNTYVLEYDENKPLDGVVVPLTVAQRDLNASVFVRRDVVRFENSGAYGDIADSFLCRTPYEKLAADIQIQFGVSAAMAVILLPWFGELKHVSDNPIELSTLTSMQGVLNQSFMQKLVDEILENSNILAYDFIQSSEPTILTVLPSFLNPLTMCDSGDRDTLEDIATKGDVVTIHAEFPILLAQAIPIKTFTPVITMKERLANSTPLTSVGKAAQELSDSLGRRLKPLDSRPVPPIGGGASSSENSKKEEKDKKEDDEVDNTELDDAMSADGMDTTKKDDSDIVDEKGEDGGRRRRNPSGRKKK